MIGNDTELIPGQNHMYGYLHALNFARKYYNNMRPKRDMPIGHLKNMFRQYLMDLNIDNNFAFNGTDPSGETNISITKKHIFIQNALMYGDVKALASVRSYLTSIED